MSVSATQTKTFTVVDIKKVVDNFAADFSMIVQATGLLTMDFVTSTVSDLKIFAEHGHLIAVTIYLFDKSGTKINVARYSVSDNAIGWQNERPRDNLWPKADGNKLRIVADFTNNWWNLSDAEKEAFKVKRGLSSVWPAAQWDTSLKDMTASSGQKYASNGYGWERTNYTK